MAHELTSGGLVNTNVRLEISAHPRPVLLRLYIRDPNADAAPMPEVAAKEAALHRLLAPKLPVPRVIFKRLRQELEQVRQRFNDLTRQSIDEALRLIDQLDEDNRLLRGRVRVLEQRLPQREIAIPASGPTQPRARASLGLVPTGE